MAPSIARMMSERKIGARRLAKEALKYGVICRHAIFLNRFNTEWPMKTASAVNCTPEEYRRRFQSYCGWLDDGKGEDELFVFYYCHCKYLNISYFIENNIPCTYNAA